MAVLSARALVPVLFVLMAVFTGCAGSKRSTLPWDVRFGPVIANELIVGRVVSGRTAWIATGGDALVRVDLDRGSYTRRSLHPLNAGEHIWGLASTGRDEMWTLLGRGTLARFAEDGTIDRRISLAEPHVGIFGLGRELLYQVMNFEPPAHALTTGPPGGKGRRPWSGMRTRALPLARGAVAALNLVSCGATAARSIPCWFPDQAAVTLTDASGASREVRLEGLPDVVPEILLASDQPRRPVRDAFVSAEDELWILASGEPPGPGAPVRPGGWLLAGYRAGGRLFRRVRLPEPARLLLGVTGERCVLLSWDGRVVEVRP